MTPPIWTERAKELRELEQHLNTIKYHDIMVGSVLAVYLEKVFANTLAQSQSPWSCLKVMVYWHIKGLRPGHRFPYTQKRFIYYKTGEHHHHHQLEHAATYTSRLRSQVLVIKSAAGADVSASELLGNCRLHDFAEIWSFLFRHIRKLLGLLATHRVGLKSRMSLVLLLIVQLSKAHSIRRFLSTQKSLELIGGDYDRGVETSVLFAVARALGIKSFTLQHGVINPPYGYAPIIADEIWVWGEFAKRQLLRMGLTDNQIRITGTPVISDLELTEHSRRDTKARLGLDSGRIIVLALSSPDEIKDRRLVRFLSEVRDRVSEASDLFMVKLHPARHAEKFQWVTDEFGIKVLPTPMNHDDFMNIVDILLITTSGIGAEAFRLGIRVGIIDIEPDLYGNGRELNAYYDIPLIKSPADFKRCFQTYPQFHACTRKEIALVVGAEAKITISRCVDEKLAYGSPGWSDRANNAPSSHCNTPFADEAESLIYR